MKVLLSGAVFFVSTLSSAQDSTDLLTISGYTELYYQYDFNNPVDNNRPGFIYSHNRHNEFNLNLGFVKLNYTSESLRANIALGVGTYFNANYIAEPGVLKNIFEASAGIKLSGKKNLWLDAGIMPSHIGFESAISKDCWNLTRSILADNTPYFEAGAKLTYTSDNNKWLVSVIALNGWQRITRLSGNSLMSWGTQLQYKPTDRILLNSSSFIGTDKPDSARLIRYFHNLYGIFNITDKLGLTASFDIGAEEKNLQGNEKNTWYSTAVILKYDLNKNWSIAGRIESYNDKNGVIIPVVIPQGFNTTGFSLNADHRPIKNILARLEIRKFSSKYPIFIRGTEAVKKNCFVTSSIAVSF